MARPSRKPKGAYHHGDLRRALLDAAIELVRVEGSHAVTLREVARRVGVTQAAPYHHFVDKDAIMVAVAEEGFIKLAAAMLAELEGVVRKPLHRLRVLGNGYVKFATQHPGHFRVMFERPESARPNDEVDPGLKLAANRAFSILVEEIAAAHTAGLLRKGNTMEQAALCWAMVHGLSVLLVDRQLPGPTNLDNADQLSAEAGDFLVRALSR